MTDPRDPNTAKHGAEQRAAAIQVARRLRTGAGMAISYAHREAAQFIGYCWLVGALLGAIVSVVRERHG